MPTISSPETAAQVDLREQLFNEGQIGLVEHIQVSRERITKIRGIMYDIDPSLFRDTGLIKSVPTDPREFHQVILSAWLSRNTLLKHAEVRVSGTGLHVLLWFDEPVVLSGDADRDRWDGIIKVIQSALPVDPNQPSVTCLTRAINSTNSKNHATVCTIQNLSLIHI